MRPLIELGDIHVQLYLDKFSGTVSSVRFLNDSTLLKQQPYELTYHGKLVKVRIFLRKTGKRWRKATNSKYSILRISCVAGLI